MNKKRSLTAGDDRFTAMSDGGRDRPGVCTVATRDHKEIRRWASAQQATPATGEATASGPAVRTVNDHGAGIRFNFPGFGPFRPITWDEWFDNFDQHDLLFVYEKEDVDEIARRAYARWQARSEVSGSDRDDWFNAEKDVRRMTAGAPALRYRIVKNYGAV